MLQYSKEKYQWNNDDVGPWQQLQSSPLENYQPKPELHTSAKKLNTLIRHTNTNTVTMMTNTDLGYTRSRVKSMDTTQQRQVLKLTPVSQYCDFRLSKQLLMSRNSTLFPKQSVPRNFLQHARKKMSQPRRSSMQDINPAIAQQIQKIEEMVRQQKNKLINGAKRISDVKYQKFLNTPF